MVCDGGFAADALRLVGECLCHQGQLLLENTEGWTLLGTMRPTFFHDLKEKDNFWFNERKYKTVQ